MGVLVDLRDRHRALCCVIGLLVNLDWRQEQYRLVKVEIKKFLTELTTGQILVYFLNHTIFITTILSRCHSQLKVAGVSLDFLACRQIVMIDKSH